MTEAEIRADERERCIQAISRKRFGPPSSWINPQRPVGWHMVDRECTPWDASMHDNGINDAHRAIREMETCRVAAAPDVTAALKPFADMLSDREQEAHEALQVGGYVPLDPDFPIEVPIAWLEAARAALIKANGKSP
jgi:hypothetical protein